MTQSAPEDGRPRENPIIAEPATVDRCQADYRRGSADRNTAYKKMRRAGAPGRS
ncbi:MULTISPECIES: hypothetical protein [Streptomyces]|uniref:Transposase n=1 Tax=Streptomyces griseiscabiei TaxID=2993540 RepID=A0ABU4LDZ6_9ACTN|nr:MULTISPECIES: hypothetical protein [Streptomyces]MBZ3908349.1 hypothetical protein [Streptomyces griseiscabiei]MDX2913863.1 hypothetical protein [Streptomyces griseiscabiei]